MQGLGPVCGFGDLGDHYWFTPVSMRKVSTRESAQVQARMGEREAAAAGRV